MSSEVKSGNMLAPVVKPEGSCAKKSDGHPTPLQNPCGLSGLFLLYFQERSSIEKTSPPGVMVEAFSRSPPLFCGLGLRQGYDRDVSAAVGLGLKLDFAVHQSK